MITDANQKMNRIICGHTVYRQSAEAASVHGEYGEYSHGHSRQSNNLCPQGAQVIKKAKVHNTHPQQTGLAPATMGSRSRYFAISYSVNHIFFAASPT